MYFDVPKVVRSPGCDHGHDEGSRNGRDINIDILDDYIQISNEFQGSPDNYLVIPETHPVTEYSHPIYQYLCLDHIETPRHVRDHIWDSEQPSVHQNI